MALQATICIDFGNTRQKAALFYGSNQVSVEYFTENLESSLEEIIHKWQPTRSILSSVINHPAGIEEILLQRGKFHKLEAGKSRLPFETPVGKPETIGADRLALCAAAVLLYPNQNTLVIGLGTAVTYNFINVRNQFLGGGISPGMHMRMRALNDYTAKLPIVLPDWNVPLVGFDTKTNIQSGVVLGLAYEIEGFIAEYSRKYRAFNVLLTGGDMVHLAPHLKSLIFADPDLLFKGLYAICDLNV
jgi:type III pantothenate kinase